jgi:hypothetical protein
MFNKNSMATRKFEKPIIAIGDVHGLTYWKEIVTQHPNFRYVFLGDYLDPYEHIAPQALMDNLMGIICLKEVQPDNTVLLLGNHDLHYFTDKIDKSSRFNRQIAKEAKQVFTEHKHLFQFAYQEGFHVFTHAGIAHEWFVTDFKGDLCKNVAEQLNHPKPEQEAALYGCGIYRGGNMRYGGIFWADTADLTKPLQAYTQVVGHNRVDDIDEHSQGDGKIIFCDCLFNKKYLKLE